MRYFSGKGQQKQRGFIVTNKYGGPLDTTRFVESLPQLEAMKANNYPVYEGMLTYVYDEDSYYKYIDGNWISSDNGIASENSNVEIGINDDLSMYFKLKNNEDFPDKDKKYTFITSPEYTVSSSEKILEIIDKKLVNGTKRIIMDSEGILSSKFLLNKTFTRPEYSAKNNNINYPYLTLSLRQYLQQRGYIITSSNYPFNSFDAAYYTMPSTNDSSFDNKKYYLYGSLYYGKIMARLDSSNKLNGLYYWGRDNNNLDDFSYLPNKDDTDIKEFLFNKAKNGQWHKLDFGTKYTLKTAEKGNPFGLLIFTDTSNDLKKKITALTVNMKEDKLPINTNLYALPVLFMKDSSDNTIYAPLDNKKFKFSWEITESTDKTESTASVKGSDTNNSAVLTGSNISLKNNKYKYTVTCTAVSSDIDYDMTLVSSIQYIINPADSYEIDNISISDLVEDKITLNIEGENLERFNKYINPDTANGYKLTFKLHNEDTNNDFIITLPEIPNIKDTSSLYLPDMTLSDKVPFGEYTVHVLLEKEGEDPVENISSPYVYQQIVSSITFTTKLGKNEIYVTDKNNEAGDLAVYTLKITGNNLSIKDTEGRKFLYTIFEDNNAVTFDENKINVIEYSRDRIEIDFYMPVLGKNSDEKIKNLFTASVDYYCYEKPNVIKKTISPEKGIIKYYFTYDKTIKPLFTVYSSPDAKNILMGKQISFAYNTSNILMANEKIQSYNKYFTKFIFSQSEDLKAFDKKYEITVDSGINSLGNIIYKDTIPSTDSYIILNGNIVNNGIYAADKLTNKVYELSSNTYLLIYDDKLGSSIYPVYYYEIEIIKNGEPYIAGNDYKYSNAVTAQVWRHIYGDGKQAVDASFSWSINDPDSTSLYLFTKDGENADTSNKNITNSDTIGICMSDNTESNSPEISITATLSSSGYVISDTFNVSFNSVVKSIESDYSIFLEDTVSNAKIYPASKTDTRQTDNEHVLLKVKLSYFQDNYDWSSTNLTFDSIKLTVRKKGSTDNIAKAVYLKINDKWTAGLDPDSDWFKNIASDGIFYITLTEEPEVDTEYTIYFMSISVKVNVKAAIMSFSSMTVSAPSGRTEILSQVYDSNNGSRHMWYLDFADAKNIDPYFLCINLYKSSNNNTTVVSMQNTSDTTAALLNDNVYAKKESDSRIIIYIAPVSAYTYNFDITTQNFITNKTSNNVNGYIISNDYISASISSDIYSNGTYYYVVGRTIYFNNITLEYGNKSVSPSDDYGPLVNSFLLESLDQSSHDITSNTTQTTIRKGATYYITAYMPTDDISLGSNERNNQVFKMFTEGTDFSAIDMSKLSLSISLASTYDLWDAVVGGMTCKSTLTSSDTQTSVSLPAEIVWSSGASNIEAYDSYNNASEKVYLYKNPLLWDDTSGCNYVSCTYYVFGKEYDYEFSDSMNIKVDCTCRVSGNTTSENLLMSYNSGSIFENSFSSRSNVSLNVSDKLTTYSGSKLLTSSPSVICTPTNYDISNKDRVSYSLYMDGTLTVVSSGSSYADSTYAYYADNNSGLLNENETIYAYFYGKFMIKTASGDVVSIPLADPESGTYYNMVNTNVTSSSSDELGSLGYVKFQLGNITSSATFDNGSTEFSNSKNGKPSYILYNLSADNLMFYDWGLSGTFTVSIAVTENGKVTTNTQTVSIARCNIVYNGKDGITIQIPTSSLSIDWTKETTITISSDINGAGDVTLSIAESNKQILGVQSVSQQQSNTLNSSGAVSEYTIFISDTSDELDNSNDDSTNTNESTYIYVTPSSYKDEKSDSACISLNSVSKNGVTISSTESRGSDNSLTITADGYSITTGIDGYSDEGYPHWYFSGSHPTADYAYDFTVSYDNSMDITVYVERTYGISDLSYTDCKFYPYASNADTAVNYQNVVVGDLTITYTGNIGFDPDNFSGKLYAKQGTSVCEILPIAYSKLIQTGKDNTYITGGETTGVSRSEGSNSQITYTLTNCVILGITKGSSFDVIFENGEIYKSTTVSANSVSGSASPVDLTVAVMNGGGSNYVGALFLYNDINISAAEYDMSSGASGSLSLSSSFNNTVGSYICEQTMTVGGNNPSMEITSITYDGIQYSGENISVSAYSLPMLSGSASTSLEGSNTVQYFDTGFNGLSIYSEQISGLDTTETVSFGVILGSNGSSLSMISYPPTNGSTSAGYDIGGMTNDNDSGYVDYTSSSFTGHLTEQSSNTAGVWFTKTHSPTGDIYTLSDYVASVNGSKAYPDSTQIYSGLSSSISANADGFEVGYYFEWNNIVYSSVTSDFYAVKSQKQNTNLIFYFAFKNGLANGIDYTYSIIMNNGSQYDSSDQKSLAAYNTSSLEKFMLADVDSTLTIKDIVVTYKYSNIQGNSEYHTQIFGGLELEPGDKTTYGTGNPLEIK